MQCYVQANNRNRTGRAPAGGRLDQATGPRLRLCPAAPTVCNVALSKRGITPAWITSWVLTGSAPPLMTSTGPKRSTVLVLSGCDSHWAVLRIDQALGDHMVTEVAPPGGCVSVIRPGEHPRGGLDEVRPRRSLMGVWPLLAQDIADTAQCV
jgi:hypothetical protein